MKFFLKCTSCDSKHTGFSLHNKADGVVCGFISMSTDEAEDFIVHEWRGNVIWNGHNPRKALEINDERPLRNYR
jgi:hypothetical protein